jgi:hypothetical protein
VEDARSACRNLRLSGAPNAFIDQRDLYIASVRREQSTLREALEEERLRLGATLSQAVEHAAAPIRAWTGPSSWIIGASNSALRRARLLGALWYLSGIDVWHGPIEPLFDILDAADVPLSTSERALLAVGLRIDVNRDARWEGSPVYSLQAGARAVDSNR